MSRVSLSSPAGVAAIMGALIGAALMAIGVWTGVARLAPLALGVVLVIAGVAEIAIAWFAGHRARLAWSFALSLNGTASVVFLFAIPKLGDTIGSRLLSAAVAAVFAAVTLLWSLSHAELSR